MQRHLALLVLLNIRRVDGVVEDFAGFLQHCEVSVQCNLKPTCPGKQTAGQKEEEKKTDRQLLPLKHSNLSKRPIPLPNPLPRQPHVPRLLILSQRHGEQRLLRSRDQAQSGFADLVFENFAPLLVAKAGLRVVEAESV